MAINQNRKWKMPRVSAGFAPAFTKVLADEKASPARNFEILRFWDIEILRYWDFD